MKPHEITETIRRLVRNGEFSQAQIAKATELSGASISQFLNGKSWSESVHKALEEWLTVVGIFTWIPTPTSSTIMTALEFTRTSHEMTLIVGHAGTGKTYTAEEFCRRQASVKYRYLTIFDGSKQSLLYAIAETFGVRGVPAARVLYSRIVAAIEGLRSPMLILDEAQHLSVQCLELVRALHDQTGLAIVLMGNEIVYRRLSGGVKMAEFAQLISRVGHRVFVGSPSKADLTTFFSHISKQMTFGDGVVPLLFKISQSPGAMRAVQKTLSIAKTLDAVISTQTIQQAYSISSGDTWADLEKMLGEAP